MSRALDLEWEARQARGSRTETRFNDCRGPRSAPLAWAPARDHRLPSPPGASCLGVQCRVRGANRCVVSWLRSVGSRASHRSCGPFPCGSRPRGQSLHRRAVASNDGGPRVPSNRPAIRPGARSGPRARRATTVSARIDSRATRPCPRVQGSRHIASGMAGSCACRACRRAGDRGRRCGSSTPRGPRHSSGRNDALPREGSGR